ncbi:exonuclease SbcCD subunit D [Marinitoga sp. 1138]|uniref:metallophosphoesterase family protein n=1 Tax=Marinitoga sp. 1138 TaxID=1643334 RepID=UPI00158697F4|nr:exonuclease SbcCD subunit D [Marinitoga sp. 1138]NUU96690.1 hypothetical protein [Marinitoga sp. 1138]
MKILHTADWHLGRRPAGGIGNFSKVRYDDYFKAAEYIIEQGIEKNVDVFIIAGDIFDRSSLLPDILYKTEKLLEKLKENNIVTFLIEGNHDRIYSDNDSWIKYFEKRKLVKIPEFERKDGECICNPITIEDINFYGIPYQGVIIDEILDDLAQKLDSNKKNIVIVHTGIGGEILPGCVKAETIEKFKGKVLYMAGGHLHTYRKFPKENPYFFVPGSPEYWDFGEGDEKGFIIFDTETNKYEFFPSNKREVKTYAFDMSDEIYDELENIQINEGDIVKLKIKNLNNKIVDTEKIEKILENKGVLKVFINVEYTSYISGVDNIKNINKEEIEKRVIESWGNIFSSNSNKVIKNIGLMKENLGNPEFINEIFDNFLSGILEGENNENK